MNAIDFLEAAATCIGDRARTRDDAGTGERSMAATVEAFNALTGHDLTEEEGWTFMGVLKKARRRYGEVNPDDYVDGASYEALAGESAMRALAERGEDILTPASGKFDTDEGYKGTGDPASAQDMADLNQALWDALKRNDLDDLSKPKTNRVGFKKVMVPCACGVAGCVTATYVPSSVNGVKL